MWCSLENAANNVSTAVLTSNSHGNYLLDSTWWFVNSRGIYIRIAEIRSEVFTTPINILSDQGASTLHLTQMLLNKEVIYLCMHVYLCVCDQIHWHICRFALNKYAAEFGYIISSFRVTQTNCQAKCSISALWSFHDVLNPERAFEFSNVSIKSQHAFKLKI